MEIYGKIVRDKRGRFLKGKICNRKFIISEEERESIIDSYIGEKLSLNSISKKTGIPREVVYRTLKENNIQMRKQSETTKCFLEKFGSPKKKYNITKEYLIENYVKGNRSTISIGKDFGVNASRIRYYLKKYGIERKGVGHYSTGFNVRISKDRLVSEYLTKKRDTVSIGNEFGISYQTVKRMLKFYGIPLREFEGNSGSFKRIDGLEKTEYIKFTNGFKNFIRKRDNQICMNCGKHREKLKRALSVHHIDYNKNISIEPNCISLCDQCHSLTNFNREYWKSLFQEKLCKLYNYKYSIGGDIIIKIKNG
jgi:transposase